MSAAGHPQHSRPAVDRLLVGVFLAALAAPWADELVRSDEARGPQQPEHRVAAPKPGLPSSGVELYKFPGAYEAYFKDSFGLRDTLLRWHSLQSLALFDTSPTTQVLLGRQGWYFYTGNSSVEVWRGLLPFRESDLVAWKTGLEARRDWLREQGIEYLFVIAPNKETVYPDFMPESLEKLGPTRLEQFADYMAQHSDLDFLDLRGPFAEARKQDQPHEHLYLEEGTHWNARGALVAYHAILEHLARRTPELAPLPDAQWQRVPFDSSGDTWASNMYIGDRSRQREIGLMRPVGSARSRILNPGREGPFGPGRKFLRGTEDPNQPRAVLFHDSFGPYIENMLAEHFSRLLCEWTYDFDSPEVLSFKPRVVIELWVERALVFWEPRSLLPRFGEPAEAAFGHAGKVCLALDLEAQLPALEPVSRMQVEPVRDERGPALRLRTRSGADSVLLPPLACEPKGKPLVHVSIDSPKDGLLDIFYLRPGDVDYSRQHNCVAELKQGPNDLYLRMPESGVTGRLRLRPAFCAEGDYLLRAFEVRVGSGP